MTTKWVRPAHDDSHNSVDLYDADRRNEFGGPWCVAPAILLSQVDAEWTRYLADLGYTVDPPDARGEE